MAADADTPEREMSEGAVAEREVDIGDIEDGASPSAADGPGAVDSDVDEQPVKRRATPVLAATLAGLVAVLALGGVAGWLGFRTYQSREDQQQRELFVRVGRQGAMNLTTIDWEHVDSDLQRILDSATGPFYDDFSQRSQPFIEIVKQVRSKSVGTITEAGLESMSDDEARVLVAVSVKTTNLGAADQPPRAWRMRIDVQKVDGGAKVSNVLFVPA